MSNLDNNDMDTSPDDLSGAEQENSMDSQESERAAAVRTPSVSSPVSNMEFGLSVDSELSFRSPNATPTPSHAVSPFPDMSENISVPFRSVNFDSSYDQPSTSSNGDDRTLSPIVSEPLSLDSTPPTLEEFMNASAAGRIEGEGGEGRLSDHVSSTPVRRRTRRVGRRELRALNITEEDIARAEAIASALAPNSEEENSSPPTNHCSNCKNHICTLCLAYYCNRNPVMLADCGHVFCFNCIKAAMDFYKKCPNCDSRFKSEDLNRIFF